jgi:hypothetical protein
VDSDDSPSESHEPLPVHGYTTQSDKALALVNDNKISEELILRFLDQLQDSPAVDKRWLAIGRTHIEQGWMAINRAIFKPQRVNIDGVERKRPC